MRTVDEIVARIEEVRPDDFFGFQAQVLYGFLPYEKVRHVLVDDKGPDHWKPAPLTDEEIRLQAADYLTFAWEKCEDHRGLSAQRSVMKLTAWMWLLGDAELERFETASYAFYGAPKLAVAADVLGTKVPEGEGIARMIVGTPCVRHCKGCTS